VGSDQDVRIVAFEQVFAEHHDRLLRIAVLYAGDRVQAEDAVAEVFARVLRRFGQLEIADMGPYLKRSVINELSSTARRRSKGAELHVLAAPPTSSRSLDDAVDRREVVLHALAQLPERQRAAIVLRYYDDLTEAATAAVLDMPVGTVKSSVARGLATLKVLLREEKDHG
jgi:RNA polymerase sigma-70 factor (sigma-E family)